MLGSSIQRSMLRQEKLKNLHDEKKYKYVYSFFNPFKKKEEYYNGERYWVEIRSLNEEAMLKFNFALQNYEDDFIKVIGVKLEERDLTNVIITELEAIAPVIVTIDQKPWIIGQHNIDVLQERLYDNLEKKYKVQFPLDWKVKDGVVKNRFFERIEITTPNPIARKYKGISLLGYKMRIRVGLDSVSQKLAKIAIAQGLGEKNSILGCGFVKYKTIRGDN